LLWLFRFELDKAHMALVYLLVVLGASARNGRAVGLTIAFLCFLAFNFFLLPPFHTFRIENPLDWLVLGTFLVTGAVAAELLAREQRFAVQAERAEALQEADRLKDALLATVSHDLRTPLTTIKALASEVRKGGDERAAIIEEEADRLNRLVADLLDLSRLRAGRFPVHPELQAAEDLVGAAVQHFSGHPDAARIRARVPDGEILVGHFDFVQSLRVLTNLLENALKHSPPGTTVELQVLNELEDLTFVVEDRGPGVPREEIARIFDPFYQPPSASRGAEGVGLGLAIARSLAQAQGGQVTYAARSGGGSRFEFRLPSRTLGEVP
jgi:two-component system sensor histidine kinase KdpD